MKCRVDTFETFAHLFQLSVSCNSQDLLTPAAPYGGENAGLHVREDPSVGFFVEGLREYTVCSHQEVNRSAGLNLPRPTNKKPRAVIMYAFLSRGTQLDLPAALLAQAAGLRSSECSQAATHSFVARPATSTAANHENIRRAPHKFLTNHTFR